MLKSLGVLLLIVIAFISGYVVAIYGIHQDIKGDQKLITKWIKQYNKKQTTSTDYMCMHCGWKKEKTKEVLDGINCPRCKGSTVTTH